MPNHDAPEAAGDLRQRRTRKYLTAALLELMEERPFKDISVVDICQRAMVHRTTFYAHFDDKPALLRYAVVQLQRELEDACQGGRTLATPRGFYLAMAKNVIAFMREHGGLYRNGVAGSGGAELRLLEEVVAGELAHKMAEPGFQPDVAGFVPDLAAHFYAGAVLCLARWWLENDMPVSDDVLLRHLEAFIPPSRPAAERG